MIDTVLRVAVLLSLSAVTIADEAASPLFIDVRTPAEFETGHLPGARNIEFHEIGDRIAALTTNKEHPIVLYCRSGRRSGVAKQTLEEMGYRNVVNAGGVNDVLRRTGADPAQGPDCVTYEC